MIIELVGPPGAGKTTISRRVAELLRAEGYEVHSASLNAYGRGLWIERLRSIVAQPRLASSLLGRSRSRTQLSAAFVTVRRNWLSRRVQGHAILDSGMVFAASMNLASGGVDCSHLIHQPDILVVLEVDSLVAVDRAHARQDGRSFAPRTHQPTVMWSMACSQAINKLSTASPVVIRIPDSDVDSKVNAVIAALRPHLS